MATKLGKVVTYCWKIPPTKSCDFSSSGHVINVKPYICTSAIPMVTKLDRVITCRGRTPTSKSRDLLIMELCDTRKKLISPLPQYVWLPNLAEW